jgi:hypothetical protein
MIQRGDMPAVVDQFERGDKITTTLHKKMTQLENEMLGRLDPTLKANTVKPTHNEDMPKYTKELVEGDSLQILAHALRFLKRRMASMFVPHTIVQCMMDSYSGERNLCLPPPATKDAPFPHVTFPPLLVEIADLQCRSFWEELDQALSKLPLLQTQTKQVVKYGNKDSMSTEAKHGDGPMRLFSLMAMQSKPTMTHRMEIKRHLELVMHSLVMQHNPRDVAVWASEWVDKGLLMGAGRPKIDFTLAIANTAHGLVRRATSLTYWMQKWVAPPLNAKDGEDCLPVMKDFLAGVHAGVKGVESAPGAGSVWKDTAIKINFDNAGDEETFHHVTKAFMATYQVTPSGGGRGRDRTERNVRDTGSSTMKRCDAKECSGLRKHGVANSIYPEMLKKNPGVKLCVACYVAMLRDEVDVPTHNNGIIKYRAPARNGKAKFAQLELGKGCKVLRMYYAHAQSITKSSARRCFIETELNKIHTGYYNPEGDETGRNGNSSAESDSDEDSILARVARLEIGSQSERNERPAPQQQEGTVMRQKMIEEWMRCNTEGANTDGAEGAKDVSDALTLFHTMKAKKI